MRNFIRFVLIIIRCSIMFVLLQPLCSKAQIQPNQIGFPGDSAQIWILGTDTVSTNPGYGNGMWYPLNSVSGSEQIPLSSLEPAISTNTIDNGDFQQEWKWDSLAAGSGLKLSSNSTVATSNPTLFEATLSGTNSNINQTTYAGVFRNYHTGTNATNYGLLADATGTAGTGVSAIGGYRGVFAFGGNYGVYAKCSSSGSYSLYAENTLGIALYGISLSSYGAYAKSFFGIPLAGHSVDSSTTGIKTLVKLIRESSGSAEDGIGGSIEFWIEKNGGFSGPSNKIISKWVDASSPTSQYIIDGVDAGSTSDLFTLSGNGSLKLNKYGLGTFTGTASKWLGVDASGNVLELAPPSGGSDDWGSQVIESDTTLLGDGTTGDPLKVDTTIIATQHYVDSHSEGIVTYYHLTSDFTTTSSSAITITGLSFTPEANKKYLISGKLLLRTSNTSVGAKAGMNWPTADVIDNGGTIRAANSTNSGSNKFFIGTANGQTNASNTFSNTTESHMAEIQDVYLIMGSSPSGDYSATIKSNGSVTMTCKAGSYIKVIELPF